MLITLTEKRKTNCPYWELNWDSLVIQPIAWSLYWLSYQCVTNVMICSKY
jgi:hypothetical protein